MVYGWKFPIQVDSRTGKIKMNNLFDDIKESIKILLLTRKGERIGRDNYGSTINRYMFETIDDELMTRIKRDLKELILANEKRIDNLEIDLSSDKEAVKLFITIRYNVLGTKELKTDDELNIALNIM